MFVVNILPKFNYAIKKGQLLTVLYDKKQITAISSILSAIL